VPAANYKMHTPKTDPQADTSYRVLALLSQNPDLTQRELAEKVGVSVGGVNYCLKALVEKGWIKIDNFSQSKNKFGYIYLLTPDGVAQKVLLAGQFLKRKLREYEQLKFEIESLKAEQLLSEKAYEHGPNILENDQRQNSEVRSDGNAIYR
jgi:EPS-associated MarR family transcriptional regulator